MATTANYGKNPYFNLPAEEVSKKTKISPYGIEGAPETSVTQLMTDGSYYFRYRIKSKDGLQYSQWSNIHHVYFPEGPDGKVSTLYEINGYPAPVLDTTDYHAVSSTTKQMVDSQIRRPVPGGDTLIYSWSEPPFLPNQFYDVFLSWRNVYSIETTTGTATVSAATGTGPYLVTVSGIKDVSKISVGDMFVCVNGTRTQPLTAIMTVSAVTVTDPVTNAGTIVVTSSATWGGTVNGTISKLSVIKPWSNSSWEYATTTNSTSFSFKQKPDTYGVVAMVRSASFPKVFVPTELTTFISMSSKYPIYQNISASVAVSTAGGIYGYQSILSNLSLPITELPPDKKPVQIFVTGTGTLGAGVTIIDTLNTADRGKVTIGSSAAIAATTITGLRT